MRVTACKGCVCPREDPRDPPINDKDPVDVPESAFYRRCVADGSLVVYAPPGEPAVPAKEAKKGDK